MLWKSQILFGTWKSYSLDITRLVVLGLRLQQVRVGMCLQRLHEGSNGCRCSQYWMR